MDVVEAFQLGLFRRSYFTQRYTFEVLVEGHYGLQVSLLHGSFIDVHVLGGW